MMYRYFMTAFYITLILQLAACTKDCPIKRLQSHIIEKIEWCHLSFHGRVCKVLFEDSSSDYVLEPIQGEITWTSRCELTLEEK